MLSYWFFFASGVVMFVSFFMETGPCEWRLDSLPTFECVASGDVRVRYRNDTYGL